MLWWIKIIIITEMGRYNRSWRYHKDLHLWITKESGTSPSQKVAGGEQGTYSYWDPENWERSRKDMVVLYADLEEKPATSIPQSQTLQLPPQTPGAGVGVGSVVVGGGHGQQQGQGQQGQQQGQGMNVAIQQQQQAAAAAVVAAAAQQAGQGPLRVGAFQGMGMAAM